MGRDLPGEKRGADLCSFGHPVSNDVAHTEPGEPVVFTVHKQWRGIVQTNGTPLKVSLHSLNGLWPQGAGSFSLTFAVDAHVIWSAEPEVIDVGVNYLPPSSPAHNTSQVPPPSNS